MGFPSESKLWVGRGYFVLQLGCSGGAGICDCVVNVLALARGCSSGSCCFSSSEKLPIKKDLSAACGAGERRRREALCHKHQGDTVSVVFSPKDLLLRLNWSQCISWEGEEEESWSKDSSCCPCKSGTLHFAAESILGLIISGDPLWVCKTFLLFFVIKNPLFDQWLTNYDK